jgi:hypothetical protein
MNDRFWRKADVELNGKNDRFWVKRTFGMVAAAALFAGAPADR